MKWIVQIQLSLRDQNDLATSTMRTLSVLSAFKNDSFYSFAAGKKTNMVAGGNRVKKEDSMLTIKEHGEIILLGLMTLKTE